MMLAIYEAQTQREHERVHVHKLAPPHTTEAVSRLACYGRGRRGRPARCDDTEAHDDGSTGE